VFPETSPLCPDYDERLELPPEQRKRWKIAIRTKEYPKTNRYLEEYVETEEVNPVYKIQFFKKPSACEIGDWILKIKRVPESEKGYHFGWLRVDKILEIKSKRSVCKWQAIQLQKLPAYHYRPFRLTDDFKDAFVIAIKAYKDEEGKELPLDEIISCPDSMLDTMAFEFC
jgi:hypothetical protein